MDSFVVKGVWSVRIEYLPTGSTQAILFSPKISHWATTLEPLDSVTIEGSDSYSLFDTDPLQGPARMSRIPPG